MPFHPYVVRQGDHLRRLAAEYGFDADEVWNNSLNADLRAARGTYNILLPGDIVQVPDSDPDPTHLETGATNAFTTPAHKPCTITHVFVRGDDPVAGTQYRVIGGVDDAPKTTDDNGTATFDVPIDADAVQIVFADGSTYLLKIGHLDPVSTPSGATQRLMHLGYLGEPDDAPDAEDNSNTDQCLAAALTAFQASNDLPSTGALDDATVKKLGEVYGC